MDESGYLPFSASGGALLFHLLSKLCERTSVVITTNLSFSEWATVFSPSRRLHANACRATDAKMTTALLDRLIHRYHIIQTGHDHDSFRFKASSAAASAAMKKKETTHSLTPACTEIHNRRLLTSREKPAQFWVKINSHRFLEGYLCEMRLVRYVRGAACCLHIKPGFVAKPKYQETLTTM